MSAVMLALAALVVVDAGRRVIDQQPLVHRSWVGITLIAVLLYCLATFVLFLSPKGQKSLRGRKGKPVPLSFLGCLALAPTLLALGALFLGGSSWNLWLGFGVTLVELAGWVLAQRTTTP